MLASILAFLLLLLALLSIPITLNFQVSWRRVLRHSMELRWAFGLVSWRVPRRRVRPPSGEAQSTQDAQPRARRSAGAGRGALALVRRRRSRRRLLRFLQDLWRAIHKEDLRLHLRLGLDDPADTGRLWALCGPLAAVLALAKDATIRLEPDFSEAALEVETSGRIRVIPLQIVYLGVALLLSPSVWPGLKGIAARS